MKKWYLLSALITTSLSANIGPDGFSEFLNSVFIETGTFGGDSAQKALDVGFRMVRSIDNDPICVKDARRRFAKDKRVTIYLGSSAQDLWSMIHDIQEPITFWLDAHVYPPRIDGGPNCPLMEELEQIKKHPIKTHTILIDDLHCCGSASFDYYTREDLIRKILEINPNYTISYRAGGDDGEYPNNVMVATYEK